MVAEPERPARRRSGAIAAAAVLGVAAATLSTGCGERDRGETGHADFEQSVEDWRQRRLETLRRPDGWLALVAREWLQPGRYPIGSEAVSRYRFEPAPARLGEIELDGSRVWLHPGDRDALELEGEKLRGPVDLTPTPQGHAPRVGFDGGRGRFEVIARGDRFALRVWHEDSPTRAAFTGLDYFPTDPGWRIEARFEPRPAGSTLPIMNVLGELEDTANPGTLRFDRDGREHVLEALEGDDGRLFVIFADRSNADETYGAGRFVYTAPPDGGAVVIDFNRAYNPPCAFSAYTTCPLPPPENRLDLFVSAGELRYRGPTPSLDPAVSTRTR